MTHRIEMLGTGNAFLPHGRHHSLALFDGVHLIDAPPTALAGLRRKGHDVAQLRTVFITHVHGDHVFGLPFLLLERTYISDREHTQPLKIVGTPFVKERLEALCELAFPGSMKDILHRIDWDLREVGETEDGWTWERFDVHHDDAVEPHGYRFEHNNGASFVHSGDSGPCETLYNAIERSHLAILEMGFPDWVPSTHHHKPSDVQALAQRCSTPLGITHTYIDAPSAYPALVANELPQHPSHVTHLNDGDVLEWRGELWKVSSENAG